MTEFEQTVVGEYKVKRRWHRWQSGWRVWIGFTEWVAAVWPKNS